MVITLECKSTCTHLLETAVQIKKTSNMRIDNSLSTITTERFYSYKSLGPTYSESTLKKHEWVITMFENFCARSLRPAWPLEAENCGHFIRFAGIEAKYAYGSLSDVVVPSMKRLHIEKTNTPVPELVNRALSHALKDVRRSPSQLKGPKGRSQQFMQTSNE